VAGGRVQGGYESGVRMVVCVCVLGGGGGEETQHSKCHVCGGQCCKRHNCVVVVAVALIARHGILPSAAPTGMEGVSPDCVKVPLLNLLLILLASEAVDAVNRLHTFLGNQLTLWHASATGYPAQLHHTAQQGAAKLDT
jgi:hypothetical protein